MLSVPTRWQIPNRVLVYLTNTGFFFFRWRKGKLLLLASLSCWIIFTLPLGFIQPPATRCIVKKNASTYMLETPMAPRVYKRDVSSVTDFVKYDQDLNDFEVPDLSTPVIRRTRGLRPKITAGRSPLDVKFASNYNEKQHYNLVMPIYSHIVYTIEVSRRRGMKSKENLFRTCEQNYVAEP